MAFDIDGARKAGYSDAEIADHMAQSSKFDAAQARKAGYSDSDIVAHLSGPASQPPTRVGSIVAIAARGLNAAQQGVGNLAAGAVRGAGSIGATLLTPVDAAARAIGVENSIIGRRDRREAMDGGLQSMGADTDSLAFGAGKIGAEIAGTLGVGGGLANVAGRTVPAIANAPLLTALRTSGMTTGLTPVTVGQKAADMGARVLTGGAAGGASAGLVDPGDAGTGAAVGAALPGALKVAGKVGQVVGRTITGPAVAPEAAAAVAAARAAGYVIPPTQARPTIANRLLEGLSGKISTAQNASAKNQQVTNGMAARALGLSPDQPITPEAIKGVRESAGAAYESVRGLGTVSTDAQFAQELMSITSASKNAAHNFPGLVKTDLDDVVASLNQRQFDSGGAVDAIRILRDKADSAYAQGEKSAGKAYKAASAALEGQLERALAQAGSPSMLEDFRAARTLIAKTYSVEKAMNPASGTVDARKLAQQLAKGKPLSGELKDAAEFAARFPKAAQAVEGMGSLPQTSPLDWAAGGGLSMATGNPLMLAGVAARPAARTLALSGLVQNRLVPKPNNGIRLSDLLTGPQAQPLYRAAPVAMADL